MRRAPLATIIEPGDQWSVDFLNRTRVAISSSEVAEIILGVKTLWVYGFVRYRDFLSESHIQGFCARLQVNHFVGSENDPETIGLEFVEGGPPAYSYDKYATKKPT